AARADVLARTDDAARRAARGLPRLLAGGRPALGDGARDRLLGRALDPLPRGEPRRADLGRPLPRHARLLRADVRGARLPDPGCDRGAPDGAPRPRGAPPPHAVRARRAPDRAQARRAPHVSRVRAALARAALRGGGRPLPARGARPDQPDLAVG